MTQFKTVDRGGKKKLEAFRLDEIDAMALNALNDKLGLNSKHRILKTALHLIPEFRTERARLLAESKRKNGDNHQNTKEDDLTTKVRREASRTK